MSQSIAIVAGQYPALSETFVRREVQGLAASGWEVHPVTLHPGDGSADNSAILVYPVHAAMLRNILWEGSAHPLRSMATLARAVGDALAPGELLTLGGRLKLVVQALAAISVAAELRGRQAKHIHCHFAHAPTTVGMYLAMHLDLSFSFVGHANDLFQRRVLLKRKLQRASFVSCISEWHRQLYLGVLSEGAAKYRMIRCGVDLRSWPYRAPREGNTLRVLSVGRLVEKKGIDTLVRAVAMLRRQQRDLVEQVVIAGDGPLRSRLEELAAAEGVSDTVQFRGACSHDQVRALMQEADVLALPCREDSHGDKDGIPVVLMEAMASGLPVIAGDLPAIQELVQHGRTGLLVRDTDGTDTAECLSLLAADSALHSRISEAAAARVRAEFSMDVNIARLVRAIQGIGEESVKCTTVATA